MNFFERQAAARRASFRLWLLFALAVFGIVIAMDLLVWLVMATREDVSAQQMVIAMACGSVVVLAAIAIGSQYRIATLRDGGESLARQMGGVQVPAQPRDPQQRRLQSVVEEIAIASGVPMPRLFVLEHESAINAFVAGYAPSDAVVAVTRGALDRLDRDELQGVIAHEFSHILNGDMRLNMRLLGMLYGILMPALVGRRILAGGRDGQRRHPMRWMAGGVAIAAGSLGLLFARIIKADISRARELSADASAAQVARRAAGLAGALKKIACLEDGATLTAAGDAEEASHMLFCDGVGLSGVFATHPPLIERIQALEPSFGTHQLARLREQWRASPPNGLEEDARLGLAVDEEAAFPSENATLPITPAMVVARVARPVADDRRQANLVLARMPAPLRALAGDRDHAATLLFALLLDDDDIVRRRQHAEIAARLGRETVVMAQALRDEQLTALHPMQRLPLAMLAFPVVRQRPRPDLTQILDTLQAVVNADGRVSFFECCLGTLLHTQLREAMEPTLRDDVGRRRAVDAKQEVATLLALVAQAAHADPARAQHAYLAGLQCVLPRDHIGYAPPARGALAMDPLWTVLDAFDPGSKQLLVEAIVAAIRHDGAVRAAGAELLRAVCAALHCPLPPMRECV